MGVILKPNGELATPSKTKLCLDMWSKYVIKNVFTPGVFEQASRINDLRRSCGVEPSMDTITIRRPVKFEVSDKGS